MSLSGSFVPLPESPDRQRNTAAFSEYRPSIPGSRKFSRGMAWSIWTDRHRFTEWTVAGTDFRQDELSNHQTDPQKNAILANLSYHELLLNPVLKRLRQGWQMFSEQRRCLFVRFSFTHPPLRLRSTFRTIVADHSEARRFPEIRILYSQHGWYRVASGPVSHGPMTSTLPLPERPQGRTIRNTEPIRLRCHFTRSRRLSITARMLKSVNSAF